MVEEDEGTNHALLRERQHAANFKAAAEVTTPLFDDHFDHFALLAGFSLAELYQAMRFKKCANSVFSMLLTPSA
jgi:hypothetical protein